MESTVHPSWYDYSESGLPYVRLDTTSGCVVEDDNVTVRHVNHLHSVLTRLILQRPESVRTPAELKYLNAETDKTERLSEEYKDHIDGVCSNLKDMKLTRLYLTMNDGLWRIIGVTCTSHSER